MDLKRAIQSYIKRGFGSMNKNDFEVFIFNQWLSFENNKEKSDYTISRELRIPESKVKRLRYESSLVYSEYENDDQRLRNEFYEDLKNAKYKADSQKLYFLVPDKLVRQYINDVLENDGRYLESSLTSSSVSIYINDFIYLIEKLKFVDRDKIVNKAKEESEGNTNFPVEWTDIVKEFLVNCAKDKLGELTTGSIINGFKKLKEKLKAKN